MRRTTAAVIGTLAGTALLTGLKLGTDGGGAGGMNDVAGQGGDLGQAPAPATTSQQPAGTANHRTKTTRHTGQRHATGLKDGSYLGDSVAQPYGRIRVGITVSGGKITAVRASYPTAGRSAIINGRAIPILKRETLQAQSAHIDSVSGATYTSPAFRESLQSALNAARA